MSSALIVIDLQNDFMSPEGALKKKHISIESIIPSLTSICTFFKEQDWPIIAIRSEYANEYGENNLGTDELKEHLAGTHTGKRKFCSPGSFGAEFHPDAQTLFKKFGALEVKKTMYSAFKDTDLHDYLQTRGVGVGPIYFAGVTANNCVLASLKTAFQLGYNVTAIEDCIGATSPGLKSVALDKIRLYYGDVVTCSGLTSDSIKYESQKPRRILYWVSGSIPSWRVMLALSLKQLKYTPKRLHVMTIPKETRSDEFFAINSRGKTPTLIDSDGTVIIESMAILQYMETYYPAMPLTPTREDKGAHSLVLQRFHETENLHNVFEDIELLFLKDWSRPDYKERIYEAYTKTLHELAFWETYLSKTKYVAGDGVSVADCAFYPNVAYLVHRGLDLKKEGFVNLRRYVEDFGEMQCAQDALPVGWGKLGKNLFGRVYEIVAERATNV